MKIGDKTTMKVQVPIIHPVRIFMISRSSTYHNTDYVEFLRILREVEKFNLSESLVNSWTRQAAEPSACSSLFIPIYF